MRTTRPKAADPLTMLAEEEADSDINSLWAATECKGPVNPLLMALGNFMIGMLLHVSFLTSYFEVLLCTDLNIAHLQIRNSILRSDVNVTMGLLMRYPPVKDIRYIMDLGDMIRR
jgi:hypothetical protein